VSQHPSSGVLKTDQDAVPIRPRWRTVAAPAL